MRERAVSFGRDNSLIGVLTQPDDFDPDDGVLLWMDAAMEHRIGPHRLYVDLSRYLAEQGVASFRFDFPGVGDSEYATERRSVRPDSKSRLASAVESLATRPDGQPERRRGYPSQVVASIDAMNYLRDHFDCNQFTLAGICAGADYAHAAAVADDRVNGVIMLDGFGYRTTKYYWHYYWPRLRNPRRWLNLLQRYLQKIQQKLGMRDSTPAKRLDEAGFRNMPTQQQVEADLPKLVDRKVDLFYVYTGELQEYYSYEEQFYDMLPSIDFGMCLTLQYLKAADHSFEVPSAREDLERRLAQWFHRRRSE